MSKLAEFKALEAALAAQLKQLSELKNDGALQREIEFEEKLRKLMGEYSVSLKDIINLLAPQARNKATSPNKVSRDKRRERELKAYKNPETGELVETKGGNNKVLKAWKSKYGDETVASWQQ